MRVLARERKGGGREWEREIVCVCERERERERERAFVVCARARLRACLYLCMRARVVAYGTSLMTDSEAGGMVSELCSARHTRFSELGSVSFGGMISKLSCICILALSHTNLLSVSDSRSFYLCLLDYRE